MPWAIAITLGYVIGQLCILLATVLAALIVMPSEVRLIVSGQGVIPPPTAVLPFAKVRATLFCGALAGVVVGNFADRALFTAVVGWFPWWGAIYWAAIAATLRIFKFYGKVQALRDYAVETDEGWSESVLRGLHQADLAAIAGIAAGAGLSLFLQEFLVRG